MDEKSIQEVLLNLQANLQQHIRATHPKEIVFNLWHKWEVQVVSVVKKTIFLHVFTVSNIIVADYSFTPNVPTLLCCWYLVGFALKALRSICNVTTFYVGYVGFLKQTNPSESSH